VINEKSQGSVARHLRFLWHFQWHCWVCLWKDFKTSQHLAKLQANKAYFLTCSVRLGTVLLKDEELARDLKLSKKQLLLTVVTSIFTWLRQLSNWCWPIL